MSPTRRTVFLLFLSLILPFSLYAQQAKDFDRLLHGYEHSLAAFHENVTYKTSSKQNYDNNYMDFSKYPSKLEVRSQVWRLGDWTKIQFEHVPLIEEGDPPAWRAAAGTRDLLVRDDIRRLLRHAGGQPNYLELNTSDLKKNSHQAYTFDQLHSLVDGYNHDDGQMNIPRLLRTNSDSVEIRETFDDTLGYDTYVLYTDTPHGEYTLHMDPQRGSLPYRIEIMKGIGDIRKDTIITGAETTLSKVPSLEELNSQHVVMDEVEIQNIDGVWVIVKARVFDEMKFGSDTYRATTMQFERTDIQFRPEVDESVFALDVPDGTRVIMVHDGQPDSSKYEWRAGNVIPAIDLKIFEAIEADIDALIEQNESDQDQFAGDVIATGEDPIQRAAVPSEQRPWGIPRFIVAAVIIAVVLAGGYYSVKRKKNTAE